MFNNQNFTGLHEALSLKSTLEQLNDRSGTVGEGVIPSQINARMYSVREVDKKTGRPIPSREATQVEMSLLPKAGEVIVVEDDSGNKIYSQVVIPKDANEQPFLRKLSKEETASLKGTRHTVEVIKAAKMIAPIHKERKPLFKMPVFLEPGERLFFSIYNRILTIGKWEQSATAVVLELIIVFCLALLALIMMWFQAAAGI